MELNSFFVPRRGAVPQSTAHFNTRTPHHKCGATRTSAWSGPRTQQSARVQARITQPLSGGERGGGGGNRQSPPKLPQKVTRRLLHRRAPRPTLRPAPPPPRHPIRAIFPDLFPGRTVQPHEVPVCRRTGESFLLKNDFFCHFGGSVQRIDRRANAPASPAPSFQVYV